MNFTGTATPLAATDIVNEANALGVEPAAVWAVCEVESAGSGFLPDKRPKILYESHYFHTLTAGRYDRAYPNISSPVWDRSLYGASGAHQYDRLAVALGLNQQFGLESCSWGRFQIMGANHQACGYGNVTDMVQAMMVSEYNHILAFGNFCRNSGLVGFLIHHDWSHFALRYNGSGQVSYYAQKLADAYDRYPGVQTSAPQTAAPASPGGVIRPGDNGPDVVVLQKALIALGYVVSADGSYGPKTEGAVISFQSRNGLAADGIVGPATRAKLGI